MLGVTFDGKHTFRDFGLHWNGIEISPAIPVTSYVDIPGRKTKLDATESVYGGITYENRELKMTFWAECSWSKWQAITSRLQAHIGGKRCKIILDIEPDKYWMGRCTVESTMSAETPVICFLTVTVDAEPYKYWEEKPVAAGKWKWNSFSFSNGFIQELASIQVSGSKSVQVVGREFPCNPAITTSADMTVKVLGGTYEVKANKQTILEDVDLPKEKTTIEVTGTGTVSIGLKGAIL